jgi:hypothetical protein
MLSSEGRHAICHSIFRLPIISFGVFWCVLVCLVHTYSYWHPRTAHISSPDEGETRVWRSGASGAQDVCTIHCFWPFRHRCWFQAGASAVCCLCRSISAAKRRFVGLELVVFLVTLVAAFAWRLQRSNLLPAWAALMSCWSETIPFYIHIFCLLMFIFAPCDVYFSWVKSPFSLVASLWFSVSSALVPQTSWYQALPRSQARILGGVGSTWGVPYMGYPNSWMVSFMEHPSTKWMLSNDFFGGPPWLWNLHIVRDVKRIWAAQMGVWPSRTWTEPPRPEFHHGISAVLVDRQEKLPKVIFSEPLP